MIDKEHELPITKQCHILQLSRSNLYYVPAPANDKDRERMRLIDEIHLEEPYLGSRGMKSIVRMRGHKVGRIHVRTLMRKMGIEALYKKPRLSKPHPGHTVYPYLIRGLDITEANRGVSSRLGSLQKFLQTTVSRSVWTDRAAGETTYLSSVYGRR